jgi:RNA-directed DNA polymerase
LGEEIKALNGTKQEDVITKLNPILRGFANYYKGVVSKETFSYISHRVWQYLWCWAKRRHPNKNTTWVRKTYFKTVKGNKWTFACNTSDRLDKEILLSLYPIGYTPIERHIKVKGVASPDDPSLKEYWEKRNQKLSKSYWAKGSKYYLIAENQQWKCPICGTPLLNDESIETHHIVPVAQGGLDDISNLQQLHTSCHKQVHTKSKFYSLK